MSECIVPSGTFSGSAWPVLASFLSPTSLRAERKRGHLMGRYRHGVPLAISFRSHCCLRAAQHLLGPAPPPHLPGFQSEPAPISVRLASGVTTPRTPALRRQHRAPQPAGMRCAAGMTMDEAAEVCLEYFPGNGYDSNLPMVP